MSIPNIQDKIKGKTGIDKSTIFFLIIIVGVGLSSYFLGRFSISNETGVKSDTMTSSANYIEENQNASSSSLPVTQSSSMGEKEYVASKNGKMYYSLDCSEAKRIKAENQVWFSSKEDAEKSGFTLSPTCK